MFLVVLLFSLILLLEVVLFGVEVGLLESLRWETDRRVVVDDARMPVMEAARSVFRDRVAMGGSLDMFLFDVMGRGS